MHYNYYFPNQIHLFCSVLFWTVEVSSLATFAASILFPQVENLTVELMGPSVSSDAKLNYLRN